jgi:hypothetical protein
MFGKIMMFELCRLGFKGIKGMNKTTYSIRA